MQKVLYTVSGRVGAGAGYGSRLGFPTANIDRREYARRNLTIPEGIYAGTARIVKGQRSKVKSYPYPAAIVIGPKDKTGLPKIEAHLLGFRGVLYGRRLKLSLRGYLRPFARFKNEAALRAAIRKDILRVSAVVRPPSDETKRRERRTPSRKSPRRRERR